MDNLLLNNDAAFRGLITQQLNMLLSLVFKILARLSDEEKEKKLYDTMANVYSSWVMKDDEGAEEALIKLGLDIWKQDGTSRK